MSEQALAVLRRVLVCAIVLIAIPAQPHTSAASPQSCPVLLSMATAYTWQPDLFAASVPSSTAAGPSLSNTQRWYVSFLTQQRVIAAQVDELRSRLTQNVIGTEEFLERLDPLLQRADRLYTQWKRIGASNAERLRARDGRTVANGANAPVLTAKSTAPAPGNPDSEHKDDVAVGKCLNYLRLSLVNLFIGYADSNGGQIADAEKQAGLSGLWRSKSLSFIRALEPAPGGPES